MHNPEMQIAIPENMMALPQMVDNYIQTVSNRACICPRFEPAGELLRDFHSQLKSLLIRARGIDPPPDKELAYATARITDRLLRYNYKFALALGMRRLTTGVWVLTPTNLATLIFLFGAEMCPKGLNPNHKNYSGKYEYYYNSGVYSITGVK